MDACPGRLNQVALFIPRPGLITETVVKPMATYQLCEAVPFEDYCDYVTSILIK